MHSCTPGQAKARSARRVRRHSFWNGFHKGFLLTLRAGERHIISCSKVVVDDSRRLRARSGGWHGTVAPRPENCR